MPYSYEELRDMVVLEVFEVHTLNGLGMDWEEREASLKDIRDAVANSYYEGMTKSEWAEEALRKLGH